MKNINEKSLLSVLRIAMLSMLGIFILNASVFAQQAQKISGQVLDEKGEPMIGAVVSLVGGNENMVTANDGSFTIKASVGSQLLVTFVGYVDQTVKVTNNQKLIIRMAEDAIQMSDLVVVAYGTQKKESLTGAIANIKSDEIVKTKAPSLAQTLQGKVAGLNIRQQEGQPGIFGSSINMRGMGTPLFIIDGIVRDGAVLFQRLNAEDIESISFLKDGTAAIYGMNSSAGAIIVTTKKGVKGKTRIGLSSNFGFARPTDVPEMMNSGDYQRAKNDASILGQGAPYMSKEELQKWMDGGPGYGSTDIYGAVFKKSTMQQQHTLSIDGGTDIITYYGSLGYSSDQGLLRSNAIGYEQYNFRSNVSIKIAKNLTGEINLYGRADEIKQSSSSFFEIYHKTMLTAKTNKIYANDNPEYYNEFPYGVNPVATADDELTGYNKQKSRAIQSLFALNYDVAAVPGLKARVQLGYDFYSSHSKRLSKSFNTYIYKEEAGEGTYVPQLKKDPSSLGEDKDDNERLDIQAQIMYNRTFKHDHAVSATYVFERKNENSNVTTSGRNFDLFTLDELNYGREFDQTITGMSDERAFLSHVGRINYGYKSKYLIEVAARYDGSYHYAPEHRWGFFPTGSVGWRVSEEGFIKNNLKFIDNLKFRASIGLSGEDLGTRFQYVEGYRLKVGGYEYENGKITSGVASTGIINPNLTWYRAKIYNVGMDLSIFDGKFSLEFDAYQRVRTGLPATKNATLPNIFGEDMPQENLNSDIVKGLDFTVGHSNKIGEFSYGIRGNFNIARTQNKYVEQGGLNSSWDIWRNKQANRYTGIVWGMQTEGQFQNMNQVQTYPVQQGDKGNLNELPGDYIYKDVNGDGIINVMDQLPMYHNGTPLVHFGLTVDARWRNFDFYALFQGSAYYTVQFAEIYATMLCYGTANMPTYFNDRWRKEDPYDPQSKWIPGKWPAMRYIEDMGALYNRDNDVWRKDASYLRLKTIELGYTLGKKTLSRLGLDYLRVYVNGNNLATWCDSFVKPFDPEKIEGEHSAGLNYPLMKSFNVGINIKF